MRRYGISNHKKDCGVSVHKLDVTEPIHWHGFYEIELCIQGEGTQYINGVRQRAEKGVIVFLSPKDFHRIDVVRGELKLFHCYFYDHLLTQNMKNLMTQYQPPFCVKLNEKEYDRLCMKLEELQEEEFMADAFHNRSLKCRIESICIDIIRSALKSRTDKAEVPLSIKESRTLNLIMQEVIPYINEHFAEAPSRDDMAKKLHLNPSYFSDVFKKRLGISYSDYITNIRMSEAMRLLKYTDKSIHAIMTEVGYHSPTAFYKKFKEYFDILPGDLRRSAYEYE